MKTPEQWKEWVRRESDPAKVLNLIELIQEDALNDPFACTTDQQELEIAKDIAENLQYQLDLKTDELAAMRAKWHETRRYLRQANRGAERNNMVMRLQAETISNLLAKLKKP